MFENRNAISKDKIKINNISNSKATTVIDDDIAERILKYVYFFILLLLFLCPHEKLEGAADKGSTLRTDRTSHDETANELVYDDARARM